MSHIGMFTPASPGHMNPMSCLGRELLARGHRVTYFQLRDCEQDVLRNGLDYAPIVEKDFPRGTLPVIYAELGACEGTSAIKYVIQWFTREARAIMAEAPEAVRGARNRPVAGGSNHARSGDRRRALGIPLVLVSNALLLNREATIPPFFTPWAYSTNPIAQVRNRLAYAAIDRLAQPYLDTLNGQRRDWKLPPVGIDGFVAYAAAHISQQPACFDFPRRSLPSELLLYRTVPRCPCASAVPVSLGAADRTPADLRFDGHAAESPGVRLPGDCGGLPRAGRGRGDLARRRDRAGTNRQAPGRSHRGALRAATGTAGQGIAHDHARGHEYGARDAGARSAGGGHPGGQRPAGCGGTFEVERRGRISPAESIARRPSAHAGGARPHRRAISPTRQRIATRLPGKRRIEAGSGHRGASHPRSLRR